MSLAKAPSAEDIKAGFVFQTLDTIIGEPNYNTLELIHTQCIRNATTVDSRLGGGGHGHAGLVELPDVYLLRTGHHFNRPAYPGDAPVYDVEATAAQRATSLHNWQNRSQQYQTCQRLERILQSMVENSIEQTYLTGIHDPAHGFGARSLIDVFSYLFATYGSLGPDAILRNQAKMTAPVDPNQPIAVLFKQIEDCQKFAAAGQVAITPAQVLKAAESLILQTGRYSSAYREWTALPVTEKTYHNFKTRMNKEYQLQNTMTTTAREAGYHQGNHAAVMDNDRDDASLASAAQDFAAATAADRAAFEQLTSTNGNLSQQVANLAMQNQQMHAQMAQLQQQVVHMANAATVPQSRQRGGRGNAQGPRNMPPNMIPFSAQNQFGAPNMAPYGGQNQFAATQPQGAPQQHFTPPMYMHSAPMSRTATTPTMTPGGYNTPHGYQAPHPGYATAQGYQQQQQMQMQQPTSRLPGAKRNNNQNYCWTHGGDIAANHTSATCHRPAQNHNPMATRQNTMGGNPKDLRKVYMGPQPPQV